MSSGWMLTGDLVELQDDSDTVLIGPDPGTSPRPKLEVVGNALVTLQDKGGNVFDVKAYGAKGDGSTDDRTRIGDAFSALVAAGGGTLYFPPGTYLVNGEIQLEGWTGSQQIPFLVQGAGPGATTLLQGSATANTIRTTYGGVSASKDIYMEVRDLMFAVKSGVTQTAGDAIRQEVTPVPSDSYYQNTFFVRNCWFRDVYNGIHLTATGSALIQGCWFLRPQNAAIFLENAYDAAAHSDVGVTIVSDNFIFKRPDDPGTYGIWATSGASGLKIHHNAILNYDHQILIDLEPQGIHTSVLVEGNLLDGQTSYPKLQITGFGTLQPLIVSNNNISVGAPGEETPVGVLVDVGASGPDKGVVDQGCIVGNTLRGGDTGYGIVLAPTASTADCHDMLISGNTFDRLATGIQLGVFTHRINVGENSFGPEVGTPLDNNCLTPLGAFFPDRVGVGRANDVSSTKEIYAYSNVVARPRVYLEGDPDTVGASPGVEFAFDHANTRRAVIAGAVAGSSGVQMDFYTKPDDSNPVQKRGSFTTRGNFIPGTDNAYTLGESLFTGLYRWKDILALAKSSVLNTSFGSGFTLVPVLEGPEYLLYDSGSAALDVAGEALVDLDPRFVEIANTEVPYRVLTSGCRVSGKERERFRLKGVPGEDVDWMVVAVRAGFENVRFRDAQDPEPVGLQDPEHAVARKGPWNNKP